MIPNRSKVGIDSKSETVLCWLIERQTIDRRSTKCTFNQISFNKPQTCRVHWYCEDNAQILKNMWIVWYKVFNNEISLLNVKFISSNCQGYNCCSCLGRLNIFLDCTDKSFQARFYLNPNSTHPLSHHNLKY